MDEYEYEVNGIRHTALLTAEHAERIGAKRLEAPANKARTTPENKGGTRSGSTRRTARDA